VCMGCILTGSNLIAKTEIYALHCASVKREKNESFAVGTISC